MFPIPNVVTLCDYQCHLDSYQVRQNSEFGLVVRPWWQGPVFCSSKKLVSKACYIFCRFENIQYTSYVWVLGQVGGLFSLRFLDSFLWLSNSGRHIAIVRRTFWFLWALCHVFVLFFLVCSFAMNIYIYIRIWQANLSRVCKAVLFWSVLHMWCSCLDIDFRMFGCMISWPERSHELVWSDFHNFRRENCELQEHIERVCKKYPRLGDNSFDADVNMSNPMV